MEDMIRMTVVIPKALHQSFVSRIAECDAGTQAAIIRKMIRAYVIGKVTPALIEITPERAVDPATVTISGGRAARKLTVDPLDAEISAAADRVMTDEEIAAAEEIRKNALPDCTKAQYLQFIRHICGAGTDFNRWKDREEDCKYYADKYRYSLKSLKNLINMYPPNYESVLCDVTREYLQELL